MRLSWSPVEKPVVGMLHAPPLPGAPGYRGDMEGVRLAVLRDAEALAEGGVEGLLLENFGDRPFHPRRVPPVTIAHMTALAVEVRRRFPLPMGVNVLRNDGRAALAVAWAAGAAFIRVNVLSGARITDQGIVQGEAHFLLRERETIGARGIEILADVDVKHSAPLSPIDRGQEAEDLVHRAGADGLIVTGPGTGKPPDRADLAAVKAAATGAPVLIGSGMSPETLERFFGAGDGFIVGSSFKEKGEILAPVDSGRVRAFMDVVRSLRR